MANFSANIPDTYIERIEEEADKEKRNRSKQLEVILEDRYPELGDDGGEGGTD